MGQNSAIEWTDNTFNPWWGCSKISPACEHCYAETGSKRRGHQVWGPHAPRRFFGDEHWEEPRKWNRAAAKIRTPAFVFCASYADVCELPPEGHPAADQMQSERNRLARLIRETPWLMWLLLTKRPEHFDLLFSPGSEKWPINAWAGATVENQEYAERRIPELLKTPAPRRFLSCEPLLGPVNLARWLKWDECKCDGEYSPCEVCNALGPRCEIGWIIVGGESDPSKGARARPMHPGWARDVREQCLDAEVPFFFKQWGDWAPAPVIDRRVKASQVTTIGPDGRSDLNGVSPSQAARMIRVGKKHAGRLLDGREYNER